MENYMHFFPNIVAIALVQVFTLLLKVVLGLVAAVLAVFLCCRAVACFRAFYGPLQRLEVKAKPWPGGHAGECCGTIGTSTLAEASYAAAGDSVVVDLGKYRAARREN